MVASPHTKKAKNTLLAVSLAVYAFNYTDGLVLALVLQNIKADLHLTDAQLGFVSGLVFATFYAVMGIPIARLADKGNRVAIVAASTAVFGLFMMACGTATTFVQLMLVRIGVALGQAGGSPSTQSLLSDFFSRAERARAYAIYALGSPLSVVLGAFAAGWINQYYGWRATFLILGVPGVVLGLLAWLLLSEPRHLSRAVAHASGGSLVTETRPIDESKRRPSLREVICALATNATFRHLLTANTVLYFCAYGTFQWQPTFFIRTHGLTTGSMGTFELLIWGVIGSLGTYGAGALIHRFIAGDERLQLRWVSASIIVFSALSILVYLSLHRYVALGVLAVAAPFYTGIFGPVFAVNQSVVREDMRATAVALLLFFSVLLGMGLGGLSVGLLSDLLASVYGPDSLRYALIALTPAFIWSATHFWLASRTVAADIERTTLAVAH